jgi:hypothetical protein
MNTEKILVGSRRIFLSVQEGTDYDYMMASNEANLKTLAEAGYKEKLMYEYLDEFTEGVFEKIIFSENPNIPNKKIQVTIKNPEYFEGLKIFWDFMAANPELFDRKVWKSSKEYPKDSAQIQAYIENFVHTVL